MRKLAATLVLLVFFLSARAQQKQIDSLKKLIAIAKDDTSRIMLTSQLSHLYVYSKPDSALLLAQQGRQKAKTAHFPKGEAYCLINISGVFSITGNYPKALSTSLEALKISEKINDPILVAQSFHDIGFAYNNVRDYRQALNYTLKAKAVAEANHMTRGFGVTLLNIGDIYGSLNMPDSALKYTQQSYSTFVKLGDIALTGSAWNNQGNIYSMMHQLDKAMLCYRKSITFLKRSADDDGICEATLGMARVFKQLGRQDSSLYYARQSIAAGWHGGFTPRVLNASQFLTDYFKRLGQIDSAYHYLEVSVIAKDSLFSQEKTREIQNLSFTERQRQMDIHEKEAAYKAKLRFYLLMAVIIFLLVMAVVFWRNNKQNKKAKTQIQHTLNELKTTQNQLVQSAKMASLGELTAGIAHEIQNPLNFVNNFSEVNEEMITELETELLAGNVKEALAIAVNLKENESKIRHHGKRADLIVKGMLEHSRSSTGERQLTNINVLADEFLKLGYHGFRAKDKDFNSKMVTDFDVNLPKINVVQQDIGRVLINIFNNAFYAVNQKANTAGADYNPLVSVATSSEDGNVVIKIKDNGNGIPNNIRDKIMQPFFTTKPTGDGTGLGLSLS